MKRKIPNVSKVILVSSGKGGVGKSTISVNLASALKQQGLKVGILDADIFGPSIPTLMNLNGEPRLSEEGRLLPLVNYGIQTMSMGYLVKPTAPIVWRGLMVMKAVQQLLYDVKWNPLDVLVIDMPPGTGDVQLTISQQLKIDGAVIVSTPQDIALIDALKGVNMFKKVRIPIFGIVENMSYYKCSNCGHEDHIFGDELRERVKSEGMEIIGRIPLKSEIALRSDEGTPVLLTSEDKHTRECFQQMADHVRRQLNI